jgi:hypothetical protein
MALDNQNSAKKALVIASYRIQKSLAKFAIRIGLSSGTMSELVRRAFIDAAEELLVENGEKVQSTKIGAMTGLYRKEIVRLREMQIPGAASQEDKYNRSARVVTGWMRDTDFLDANGEPAVLALRGDQSFSELVKRYSGDMAVTALREELQRLGIVEIIDENKIKLLSAGYVSSDSVEGIHILGADTSDLIDTIHHNLSDTDELPRFQRKVKYVGIPDRFVEEFRSYSARSSQALLEDLDRWLAERDIVPTEEDEPLTRLGLGIYHIEGGTDENADSRDEL